MKKRKIIVTGSLAATLLFTNAKATMADTVVKTEAGVYNSDSSRPVHLDYAPGSGPTLSDIAVDLGIDADDFREELRSGMTPREVLEDQGFSPSQIQKVFTTASTRTHSKYQNEPDE